MRAKIFASVLLLVPVILLSIAHTRTPFTTPPNTIIGVDLPDLSESGPIFVDAMKQAVPWTSREPLSVDAFGNVIALHHGQIAETVIYKHASYPKGMYTLLYEGRGRFDVSRASGSIVLRSPGRMLIRVQPRPGYGIHLLLLAAGRDYPHRIRLLLPGYERVNDAQIFVPAFVRMLRGRGPLHYSNWMHGNTYAVSAVWPARTTMRAFTQDRSGGVALEYLIALANATHDTPWFSIPVGATDYWVENFTTLLLKRLDPRLHPVIEYGDRVWQRESPANRYAIMAARNVGLHGDPLAWYALRSTRVFSLVRHGFDGRPFIRVLAGPLPRGDASGYADAFSVAARRGDNLEKAREIARAAGLQLFAHIPLAGRPST